MKRQQPRVDTNRSVTSKRSGEERPTTLMWFRHDLRLDDHPTLNAAIRHAERHKATLLLVWFFEDRWLERDTFGTPRIGSRRAQFLLESATALQQRLRPLGQDLLILRGSPLELLPQLTRDVSARAIFASHHIAHEETEQERELERVLSPEVEVSWSWSHTLLRRAQLPFSLSDLPEVFTRFRKRVERDVIVDQPLETPNKLPPPPTVNEWRDHWVSAEGELLREWSGLEAPDTRSVLVFKGGERAARSRLDHYLWESRSIEVYKETRNGLIGADYSTKFSPWLNAGSLSPRRVWAETLRYERERVANDSTYWVRFELLWREYFQWVAAQFGSHLFRRAGLTVPLGRAQPRLGSSHRRRFESWCQGSTRDEFVNANMQELNATGWMSNRGRQNVASYLVHDLGLDWRMGAGYFEQQLLDYDPASNWGNWAYIAGVGNDPRPQRKFNTRGQAERYDPGGRFRDLWLKA